MRDDDRYDNRDVYRMREDDEFDDRRYPDFGDYDRPRRRKKPLPQSGLGVISLLIAIVSGVFEFLNFVAAALIAQAQGGELDENSNAAIVIGILLFAGVGLSLIGGVIGIIGLMQPKRTKTCAILGVVLNGLVVGGMILIILVGLLTG